MLEMQDRSKAIQSGTTPSAANNSEMLTISSDFTSSSKENQDEDHFIHRHKIHEISHQSGPLLASPIARVVSSISMASRVSLRLGALIVDSFFDSLKFSTAASLGVGRRALVSAISSARTLHLLASGESGDLIDSSSNSRPFYQVLDYYTNTGIYAIHATFSLAELLTLTTFHLYSASISFSLEMAEEAVHIFDGLFGETDTSKALAAIIGIFMQEWQGQDDALGLTQRFGKIYALGQITKTFIAYICLQYLNRYRWRSLVKLTLIYKGRVRKVKGGYDPSATVKTKDMFSTSVDPLVAKSPSLKKLPQMLRRASMEMLRNSFNQSVNSTAPNRKNLFVSKSYEDLAIPSYKGKTFFSSPLSYHESSSSDTLSDDESQQSFIIGQKRRRCHSDNIPELRLLVSDHTLLTHPLDISKDTDIENEDSPKLDIKTAEVRKGVQTQTSFACLSLNDSKPNPPPTAAQLIKNGARFVQFAVGAYGTAFLKLMGIEKPRSSRFDVKDEHHNHYSLANHTDVPVHHIISSSFDSLATLHAPRVIAPVHYVVVDQETKSVVVSLRGTLGLSDIVTDLTAHYDHYIYETDISGFVHSGIYNSAKQIATSKIKDAVTEALNSHPTYSLVLTGHSLGGGCAALLSMLWSCRKVNPDGSVDFVTDTSKGLPLRSIHCYVFACPAVMSSELSKCFYDLITTFVYRHDIVPCLSLGMVRDFRNITVSFCHEEGMAESVIAKVLGIFGTEKESDVVRDDMWYWALLKTLRADMKAEKLYPPGRVYWINGQENGFAASDDSIKNENSKDNENSQSESGSQSNHADTAPISIWEVDDVEVAFSEIVFSTSMFTDHSPHHYEGSLSILSKLV